MDDSKPMSKQAIYSMVSSHSKELILRVLELTKSKNENVALGACKLLMNKIVPDLKSTELNVDDNVGRPMDRFEDDEMTPEFIDNLIKSLQQIRDLPEEPYIDEDLK